MGFPSERSIDAALKSYVLMICVDTTSEAHNPITAPWIQQKWFRLLRPKNEIKKSKCDTENPLSCRGLLEIQQKTMQSGIKNN